MAEHMRTELVQNALEMAVRNCQPIKGVTIFHSDRGSQYTSADYTATMNKYGLLASVGRTGVCYDNAAAESFNTTCKKELVNRKIYHTRRKAIKEVTSWIELCYNQTRLHPSLGYRTPNEVHQEWRKTKTAA
jgi:integrase family protein